jgi:hypothetical protein
MTSMRVLTMVVQALGLSPLATHVAAGIRGMTFFHSPPLPHLPPWSPPSPASRHGSLVPPPPSVLCLSGTQEALAMRELGVPNSVAVAPRSRRLRCFWRWSITGACVRQQRMATGVRGCGLRGRWRMELPLDLRYLDWYPSWTYDILIGIQFYCA